MVRFGAAPSSVESAFGRYVSGTSRGEIDMNACSRIALASALVLVLLAPAGCRTVGTAVGTAGEVAGDTARAAGDLAGTAARGAGRIVKRTADAVSGH